MVCTLHLKSVISSHSSEDYINIMHLLYDAEIMVHRMAYSVTVSPGSSRRKT